MAQPLQTVIEQFFVAVEAKDVERVLAFFADDAVVIDPNYPTPRMAGKQALAAGLTWAFATLQQLRFTIVKHFEAADGQSAAVEVATAHVVRQGMHLRFPQTFVFDTRDGKITRMQAYQPYGPNGVGGIILGVTRLIRRVRRQS